MSQSQIDALKILSKQVVDKLELRRKIKTLGKTNQELLNSNVLIQKFASMAAHDIKNPLSSILLSSEALKRLLPEEKHDLYLSVIAFDQIMINLISNAIRYNDKEKGEIQIRFQQDETFYRFEIEDNGPGIPQAFHEKIFDNNFTLKKEDRNHTQGTGIGLSTVKDLINALKGTISVQSVTDQGTTFSFAIRK